MQIIKNILLNSSHQNRPFTLDLYHTPNPTPQPLIVFIHGFNAFKDWGHFDLIAQYFAQNGFVFVKFNLSHNGTTPEHPREFIDLDAYGNDKFSTDLDDVGTVLDYLHSPQNPLQNAINLQQTYLIGHSRGGAIAILKAAEDLRVKKIATWASIISTMHFWTKENIETVTQEGVVYVPNSRTKQQLPLYKAYYEDVLINAERLNVEKGFKKLQCSILIIHGNGDTSIPVKFAHQLKEWQPNAELFLLDHANHTFGGYEPYNDPMLPDDAQKIVEKTAQFFIK